MATSIEQHPQIDPAREKLPPVEKSEGILPAEPLKIAPEHPKKPPTTPAQEEDVAMNPTEQPGGVAKSIAHWIHKHPQAHKHGAGVLVYQFVRSAFASIPYGLSMAATLAAFTGMERGGGALAAKTTASAFTRGFGRNLKAFAGFGPAKMSALIGTSFTFYRGTSKLGKWLTEYLFNPKDSEDKTAEKVSDLVPEGIRKVKEIFPAEAASTPVSAIVLGFIVSAFTKPSAETLKAEIGGIQRSFDWTRENFKSIPGVGNKLKVMWSAVAHPNAKFVSQSVINTFGYSLFFELGDRLYKDAQIRRGVWAGEHNSIKALKAEPDEYEQGLKESADDNKPKYADSALEPVKEHSHYSFFTSEPSVGRFLFRRVLPTAAGITAYTAAKMRWAPMLGNDFKYAEGKMLPQFLKKSWGEGAATSLFFLVPIVTEPWEKMYDNYFKKKDKIAQMKDHPERYARTLTPQQEQNYETLLARVNAKEQVAANDGIYAQRA